MVIFFLANVLSLLCFSLAMNFVFLGFCFGFEDRFLFCNCLPSIGFPCFDSKEDCEERRGFRFKEFLDLKGFERSLTRFSNLLFWCLCCFFGEDDPCFFLV